MRTFAVAKAQGTGNDFIIFDNTGGERLPFSSLAQRWCARRFGIGADGLLVLEQPTDSSADIAMRIFNADGSEAEMCGNGIRCVARYFEQTRPGSPTALTVQTASGAVRTRLTTHDGSVAVAVDMGVPRFARSEIPMRGDPDARAIDVPVERPLSPVTRISALSIGNPHCVAFLESPVELVALADHVAALEKLDLFPNGANYEIAHIANGNVHLRVFERGVGETQACGSGACAVGVAAILTARATSPLDVLMPGGSVSIGWAGPGASVSLTGPAEIVFFANISAPDAMFAASHTPVQA
ncbi:MAG TPA: diaminopimelate epimerase [Candidatus Eremiobacteraceae bacterium]|nr:diaminopimelate epimerase [Candidatus Eremiobacteraceae bacterium]